MVYPSSPAEGTQGKMMSMAVLLLFDIDNTLLYSGGAGGLALNLAFAELFGIEDGFAGMDFAGRIDVSIFREAADRHHLEGDFAALLARFKEAYHRYLEATLPRAQAEGRGRVLPGVRELLAAISGRPEAVPGVATGNFRQGAMMKLSHYGLDAYLRDGAYGDDAEERAGLVAIAIQRLARQAPDDGHQVYIIGDTPLDVLAAKANGALAVAVATGRYGEAELRACGADLVMPDLTRWRDLLPRLLGDS